MNLQFNPDGKHRFNRFSKLGMWYILALSVIATVSIIGQLLIQRHLKTQLSDSRVINLAGAQRYKSQWIVKMCVLLGNGVRHEAYPATTKALGETLSEWRRIHYGLQNGDEALNLPGKNSEAITTMFRELEPYFVQVYESARRLAGTGGTAQRGSEDEDAMATLLSNEAVFLKKMDRIVFQYDHEAKLKVATLGKLEYMLLAISICVIVLEILFVFRPTTVRVNRTMNELIASEKNAKKLSREIGELYASLERSYEQLSQVNEPVENPRLLAKADRGGNITFVTPLFAEIAGLDNVTGLRIPDLFRGASPGDDWMDDVIDIVAEGKAWQGEIRFLSVSGEAKYADVIINPVSTVDENDELLILASDITRRKEAEQNMVLKNKAEIEKKINQQKFRSVLILEGQEEERKRLAMDIHDGIGQMLTSLKYQIESIDLARGDDASGKIREVQQLINQVIREVRRVTFNLKPTVLGDYGIQAALNVFVREIGKLTETRLAYHVSGEMSRRLPQQVENNIFRIVQEAVNNALKYSAAALVEILFEQKESEVIVTVRDNGKGFDEKKVEARNINVDSGRGFFNMYERAEYINARLEIKSAPGRGTTVTLTVPVTGAAVVNIN